VSAGDNEADNLRRLQLAQLQIAVEVTDLCDRHHIRYALLGGSALGARRHRGFIPWDDDMDIGMLREDFDRFLDVARTELPASLYVQHWLDDPQMGAPFAKVRRNHTVMLEEASKDTGGHKGISIDIFPFDNVPDGPAEYPWKLELKFWKRLLRHQTGYTIRKLALPLYVADLPTRVGARIVSPALAKRRMHKVMTRFRHRRSDRVLAVGGAYDFKKDMLQVAWLSNVTRQAFEDRQFYCPTALDDYLAHMYGDFMALPPVEQRRSKHRIRLLDFGDAPAKGLARGEEIASKM
jgi:lipopolysaccharide cholinephosphotransferase